MQEQHVANPKDLEVPTAPIATPVGVDLSKVKPPRPDLNGTRLKRPDSDDIYFVDQGYRRLVPDASTYNNLFESWDGIVVMPDADAIPEGPPIPDGAILAKDKRDPIYLIDRTVKRQILLPAFTMVRYHFAAQRVYVVPRILLEHIRSGSVILARADDLEEYSDIASMPFR